MPYHSFYFESFTFDLDEGEISLHYSFDKKLFFTEKIFFVPVGRQVSEFEKNALEKTVKSLHIAAGISYFKAFLPHNIVLENASLSLDEKVFWEEFYRDGLGQFFFENNLEREKYTPSFPYEVDVISSGVSVEGLDGNLLAWGGGKDSCVSSLLLDEKQEDYLLFTVGESDIKTDTALQTDKILLLVHREIDPQLFEVNTKGAYNGHVPITGILAFIKVFFAILYQKKNIILSNEKSANFGNVLYQGMEINHQYSKSAAFEKKLSQHIQKNISPDISYYSLLRDMYEIEIAEVFAKKGEKFFSYFSSCNRNFHISKKKRLKQNRWCNSCPKCAFVYLLLSAYLEKDQLLKIFGEDLFEKTELFDTFDELLGKKNFKPLECVGTPEESMEALKKASQKKSFEKSAFIMQNALKHLF